MILYINTSRGDVDTSHFLMLQNSLSEGESEGDEQLLEDALEESFSVLEEKDDPSTPPVFRQDQLTSATPSPPPLPFKYNLRKNGNHVVVTESHIEGNNKTWVVRRGSLPWHWPHVRLSPEPVFCGVVRG
jgi:hypothetical protein